MTGYYCPVEGGEKHDDEWDDDQPPFASPEALRGHTNAMGDDDHQQARDEGPGRTPSRPPKAGTARGTRPARKRRTSRLRSRSSRQTTREKGGR
ncbi:hypothetical protein [Halosolutus gelatinilyticus]|uniref:hypothetical protein n=1 Tax=Halosolutus gelatinilyticus TaxID=2931975 RepID=UPI001FF446A7|nr:hypothetical protein [Halosolutus gelatinilyticus]